MSATKPRPHGNAGKPATHVVRQARSASLREPFMPLDRPAPTIKRPWQPKPDVWAPLPGTTPVPLDERKGCKWPIGESHPFLYCNALIEAGSYCAAHAEISRPKRIEGDAK